jgi:hypothetical protein
MIPAEYPHNIAGVITPATYKPPTTIPQLNAIPKINYG